MCDVQLVKECYVLADAHSHNSRVHKKQNQIDARIDPPLLFVTKWNEEKHYYRGGNKGNEVHFQFVDRDVFALDTPVVFLSDGKFITFQAQLIDHEHVQHFFLIVNGHTENNGRYLCQATETLEELVVLIIMAHLDQTLPQTRHQ